MIKLTSIKAKPVYYNTIEEAIVACNPHFRKILLPETVKQPQAIENSIDLMKTFAKKCGLKINGRFPEDIIKYEKKLKYAPKNPYSNALKEFMDILVNNQKKRKDIVGEVLLNFELRTKGKKILERNGFIDKKI